MLIQKKQNQNDSSLPFPVVFNCTSGTENPLRIADHNRWVIERILQFPINDDSVNNENTKEKSITSTLFQPSFCMVKNRFQYDYIWIPVYQTIPGFFIDLFRVLQGKKPIMKKIYKKISSTVDGYSYFSSHGWEWETNNTRTLFSQLNQQDKINFNFDWKTINWREYLHLFYDGCRQFAKENQRPTPSSSLSSSTKKY